MDFKISVSGNSDQLAGSQNTNERSNHSKINNKIKCRKSGRQLMKQSNIVM